MLRQMERSTIHLLAKRGQSLRQIAQELGRSPTTVARVLREPVDRAPARRRRPSVVDPYREQIAQWVREGLTGVRMLELARADPERPYPGRHTVFRAAVQAARRALAQQQAVADVPVRFEGLPAEYLQVDWGEVRAFPFTQQAPATRYFLACRLKYSRWVWVRFTTEMRQETLFRGLVDCCGALGWVPWMLVFDNMKTVTTGRDAQHQPVWHPALLQLAAEFGFHPEACTPGAGNQKGSVESLVKWVKRPEGSRLPRRAGLRRRCRPGGAVRALAGGREHPPFAGDGCGAPDTGAGGSLQGRALASDGPRLRLSASRAGERRGAGGGRGQPVLGAHPPRRRAGHRARPPASRGAGVDVVQSAQHRRDLISPIGTGLREAGSGGSSARLRCGRSVL
jgi:transposase